MKWVPDKLIGHAKKKKKKKGAQNQKQNQSARLIKKQLETLILVFYYLNYLNRTGWHLLIFNVFPLNVFPIILQSECCLNV